MYSPAVPHARASALGTRARPITPPRQTAEAAQLQLTLLGGFHASIGPHRIDDSAWRLRRPAGLLKLLALAPGHRLHREHAMDLLWPDLEPAMAANNLRVALHAVRRALTSPTPATPATLLQRQGDCLVLCPDSPPWVDAAAFRTAVAEARRSRHLTAFRAAADLYTGDLLPDDRYEDWAAAPREELRALYRDLLAEFAQALETAGHLPTAIQVFQRLLESDPLHEPAHAALMRLHALTGQRERALAQYRRLHLLLRDQLDAEPDAVTERLYQDILTQRLEQAPPPVTAALAITPAAAAGPTTEPHRGTDRARPHNLPSPLTSFVGRERELGVLTGLLQPPDTPSRLVTLTGPGGGGKTRLALETAERVAPTYPDGVRLVELAALADPLLVPQAVAATLDVRAPVGRPLATALADALRAKRLLLVLDNCEHVAAACAALADQLLRACPQLRILATSRQRLDVAGEKVWPVPPLAAPEQLFVERARLVLPDFALTPHNAAAIAAICRRVDGLPLAIELAAARLNVLSVDQLAARLAETTGAHVSPNSPHHPSPSGPLALLTAGGTTTVPRHQTLRGVIDWSYDLLGASERALFTRLSVFAGPFDLEAAEAIAAGPPIEDVLPSLASLIDKSLVLAEHPARDGIRYRLLETLRAYAGARLVERGEDAPTRRAHARACLALAEQAESQLRGPDQAAWLDRLEGEHDNLRAALAWLEVDAPDLGLRLAAALAAFWAARGHLAEGHRWLCAMLARDPAPHAVRVAALRGAGVLARMQGDFTRDRAHCEDCLATARAIGDEDGTAAALFWLGTLTWASGDHARTRLLYEESLRVRRALGSRRGIAATLLNLAILAYEVEGDYSRAHALLDEALPVLRDLGDQANVASALGALSDLTHYEGDYVRATALAEELLAYHQSANGKRGAGWTLRRLAHLRAATGNTEDAERRLEESLALLREVGDQWGAGMTLGALAHLRRARGDHGSATTLLAEALPLAHATGDRAAIARILWYAALLALARSQHLRGARLLGAAIAAHPKLRTSLWPEERDVQDRAVARAQSGVGEAAFTAAHAAGQALSIDAAVAEARAVPEPPESIWPVTHLVPDLTNAPLMTGA